MAKTSIMSMHEFTLRLIYIFSTTACLILQPSYSAELNGQTCSALTGQSFNGVSVDAVEWLDRNSLEGGPVCVVSGHRPPYLDIEVVLPANWSGRYLQQGGGGFDGFIPSAISRDDDGGVSDLHEGVASFGAVYASSNGGNRRAVAAEAAPAVWLEGGPGAMASLKDYAYLATKTTMDFADGLTKKVFGRLPDYSYFNGCSNGGRNAYIAGQRWPQRFDGIVSGCEAMNLPGTTTAWLSLAGVVGTPAELTATQFSSAYAAAVSACDGDDGAVDGLIANPEACDYSPRSLACSVNDADHCLSVEQVTTLEKLLSDVTDSGGNVLASGFYWSDFGRMVPGFSSLGAVHGWIGTGDQSWMQPGATRQFDPDEHHYQIATGLIRKGLAHDRIGVAQYVASGRKLISWHAGADGLLSARDHARQFSDMMDMAASLANGTDVDVDDSARFFIVPGVNHGGGSRTVGWIEAIVEWTENGNAPQNLVHAREDGSTIPVCEFPAYARGSANGYHCTDQ